MTILLNEKFKKAIVLSTILLLFGTWISAATAFFFNGSNNNLWQVIPKTYTLLPSIGVNSRIQAQINQYLQDKEYFTMVSRNAQPYLYYVYQEVMKRHMPAELALLPIVESDYYPFCLSGPGAEGVWQMMHPLASDFKMTMNWWFEGRRDLITSTHGALSFLQDLYNQYHDWPLALAAYNAGPGVVDKAIKRNKKKGLPTDYWSLKLPKETEEYVPRLLAVANIIQKSGQYHVKLNQIANAPAFSEVTINHQINIAELAQMIKMDTMTLLRLNPDFRRWITPPNGTYTLLVPADKAALVQQDLTKFTDNNLWMQYQVQSKDSLGSIAKHFALESETIIEINSLHSNHVKPGQIIRIPLDYTAGKVNLLGSIVPRNPNQTQEIQHAVFANENLKMIAQEYHTTPQQIKGWNHLSSNSILPGETLAIWLPAHQYFSTHDRV